MKSGLTIAVAAVCFASSHPLRAANFYWDTNGSIAGTGGDGTWDNGITANWNTASGGTGTPQAWNNANIDGAYFSGTPGNVTVSGAVSALNLFFTGGAGVYSLTGGAITLASVDGTILTALSVAAPNVADINIGNNLNLTLPSGASVNASKGVRFTFSNASSKALTFGGNIAMVASDVTTGKKTYDFDQINSAGSITLNGSFGAAPGAATASVRFGENGGSTNSVYYLNGNNTALDGSTTVSVAKGKVLVGSAGAVGNGIIEVGSASAGASDAAYILTNAGLTINNNIKAITTSAKLYLGGNTAAQTTFTGSVTLQNPLHVTAAAGGRVDFSGSINQATGSIVKEGEGIVRFTRALGNSYGAGTTVNAGALVLMNTSSSATGAGGVAVNSEGTLAGTGFASGMVTTAAGSSSFSPGDMSMEGVSSIGTLNLTGGLNATAGATFKLDLDAGLSDRVNFGSANLTLGGTITFDFVNFGTVDTDTAYSIFQGTGTWTGGPSFVFNAPVGYELDTNYGGGTGYVFDASNHLLSVQFDAVPEPSTVAFLGASFALAGIIAARRRIRACGGRA